MAFGKRLKEARLYIKWEQSDLVRESGVAQATISAIESRDSDRTGYRDTLIEAFPPELVNRDYIRTGRGSIHPAEKTNVSPAIPRSTVPLISWVRAGGWGEIDDHQPDTSERVDIYHSRPSHYAFALTVEGDSMTAPSGISFPDGCVIVVDPERSAKAGDYVVAKDVDTQRATFKRLMTDSGRWYLRPLNSGYPTIEIDDPAHRVIGVAIEWHVGGKL